jgi:hypothetical protein
MGGVVSPAELDSIRAGLPPTPIALVEACMAACSNNSTTTSPTTTTLTTTTITTTVTATNSTSC